MTAYALSCLGLLLLTYLINTTMISVFYHRGLAHGAVTLSPRVRRVVVATGIWLTGLDPKGWVCMHRRHHTHSDGPEDPHSPVTYGIVGVLLAQLRSYERTLVGLARRDPTYTTFVQDLDFDINALNRKRLWILPYALHVGIALAIAAPTGMWLLGACYVAGMMSHPLEGWIVNAFGHAVGGRNFDTPDNSRNNHLAAWLIVGEGFQNNHHRYPSSARFSYRALEVDLGYGICRLLEACGCLRIRRELLMPRHGPAQEQELAAVGSHAESARFRRLREESARRPQTESPQGR